MDRIWQWAWDRYKARYSWAIWLISLPVAFPVYLFIALMSVALEHSDRYFLATVLTVVVVVVLMYVVVLPGRTDIRAVERWAGGAEQDPVEALGITYRWGRRALARAVVLHAAGLAVLLVAVAVSNGAPSSRVAQYAVLGAFLGIVLQLIAAHGFVEGALRPARIALVADTERGDELPRVRPSFATWSNVSMLAAVTAFSVGGGMVVSAFASWRDEPIFFVAIGRLLAFGFGVPITIGAAFSPSLQPIRDLAAGTERVAAGDYGQRLPVAQDDDLGALAASFNRMQAGLLERQRLQAAFGSYVDPLLAARLLEQGDDVFSGERKVVTVMFIDIRDFTSYAEATGADEVVARLNALSELVVPAVVDGGGHVNKFLGDGALAVFGAPNELAEHADAAVAAALRIHRLVAQRFAGALKIGIGINSGPVIAGTIGGAGKLEFTLIGDAVNVASRVEQLTKLTGDAILLTEQTVEALDNRPPGLVARGAHELKGKTAAVRLFGLESGN